MLLDLRAVEKEFTGYKPEFQAFGFPVLKQCKGIPNNADGERFVTEYH